LIVLVASRVWICDLEGKKTIWGPDDHVVFGCDL